MPELALPIDGYSDPATGWNLPVAAPIPAEISRVVINTAENKPEEEKLIKHESGYNLKSVDHNPFEKLFGLNGTERYKTWPEKLITEALTAGHDVMTEGTVHPGWRREDFTDIPKPDM